MSAAVNSHGQLRVAPRLTLHPPSASSFIGDVVLSGREQLALLLDLIAEGHTLVVTKLDRLARSTLDMLTIITKLGERGVKFVSLAEPWANTDNPASKLMLTVMAGIAEFERGRIRERQREGNVLAKTKGVFKGGKVRFDPTVIQQKHAEGMTPNQIARQLGCNPATVFRALRSTAPEYQPRINV